VPDVRAQDVGQIIVLSRSFTYCHKTKGKGK
jgi:hypothetical protein